MPRLAPLSRDKFIRVLTRAYRCHLLREGGRHTVYARADLLTNISVPRHRKISQGVIRNTCEILDVSVEDFLEKLREC